MLDWIFDIIFIAAGIFFLFAVAYSYGFLFFLDDKAPKKIEYKDNIKTRFWSKK